MKELITKKNENFELTNDFTREIDTYLTRKKSRCFSTHFYETPFGDKWLFRYPGATRGNIEVDENMIIKNFSGSFPYCGRKWNWTQRALIIFFTITEWNITGTFP